MANNIDQYKAKESNFGSFTATPVNSENEQRQNILYDYYKGGGIFNDANYQNWRNEKAKTPTNYIAPNKSKPDKPKNNIFNFSDLVKDSPSADDVDKASIKSNQYYRTQVEKMLGHPVDALNDEQVKELYIKKTGNESPYLNTGSDNPYYTPTMAAIDNSSAATAGDLPFSSQEESERTRGGSAYWDANRDERHNVNPVQGYYAELYANRELPKVSDQNDNYWAQSPENMILDTSVPNREETRPTAERNYGNYYDGRSGNTMYTRYDEPVGPPAPTATQNYGNYYDGRTGNTMYSRYDEPVGPPTPVATQNYGSYYDGRSGNDAQWRQELQAAYDANTQRDPYGRSAGWQERADRDGIQDGRPGGTYNGRPTAETPSERDIEQAYEDYLSHQLPRQGEEPQLGRPGGTYNGRPNYGRGNIDLNNRPILWNDDGSWSTVDSTIWGVDDKQVLMPTVIQQDGEWRHVDPNTALQHYFDTGEHLGKFDTVEEAGAYGEQLHNDQAQQYYPEMQRQREERRNSGRVYINNATGDMTPDARYRDIYDQLSRQGLTRDEILEWANGDAMEYMSPEEAMRFYIYAGNQRR